MTSLIEFMAGALLWACPGAAFAQGSADASAARAAPRPVEPPLGPARGEQDPDRPLISLSDLKALRENNIFSPPQVKRPDRKPHEVRREHPKTEPPAPRPKPPVVTGFVYDAKIQSHLVLVEDRNEEKLKLFREPRFLKPGDELLGFTVESAAADRVVVKHGETTKELKVGESFPDIGFKAPEGQGPASPPAEGSEGKAEAKTEAKPLNEGAKGEVLDQLKKKNKKNRSADSNEP